MRKFLQSRKVLWGFLSAVLLFSTPSLTFAAGDPDIADEFKTYLRSHSGPGLTDSVEINRLSTELSDFPNAKDVLKQFKEAYTYARSREGMWILNNTKAIEVAEKVCQVRNGPAALKAAWPYIKSADGLWVNSANEDLQIETALKFVRPDGVAFVAKHKKIFLSKVNDFDFSYKQDKRKEAQAEADAETKIDVPFGPSNNQGGPGMGYQSGYQGNQGSRYGTGYGYGSGYTGPGYGGNRTQPVRSFDPPRGGRPPASPDEDSDSDSDMNDSDDEEDDDVVPLPVVLSNKPNVPKAPPLKVVPPVKGAPLIINNRELKDVRSGLRRTGSQFGAPSDRPDRRSRY